MSYLTKTISEVISEYVNKTLFLPAIQREFVWESEGIEKLFDSIMSDYPIGSLLFWKIKEENKNEWTAYEFIRDFDQEHRHNNEANMAGINQDIYLALDGQQRITALYIGLKGTYRYFYFRWRRAKLYLNLFKEPAKGDSPEEFTYQFQFRENDQPDIKDLNPQFWYLISNILNFEDAEDAKKDIKQKIALHDEKLRDNANSLVGRLHTRIHISKLLNYYEEKSQDYDKVVEEFIRANAGGKKLEYSDILLSTATAKWKTRNAREEIHSFTDDINTIGNGYTFEKDFVLKGSLYLTDGLPIQYKIKNFTRTNLEKIENNWDTIENNIQDTIKLVSKFGFNDRNLISKAALLPIAFYLKKINRRNFVDSTHIDDVKNQNIIQKWLTIVLLKNSFGGSSDTTLKNLQDTINEQSDFSTFPFQAINRKLNIETFFSDMEIENFLSTNYGTKYSYLILSLLYPDRDWKDASYQEDHIFPKSEFTLSKLEKRELDIVKSEQYRTRYNTIVNLQLLKDSENLEKHAKPFDTWLATRDENFRDRNLIPLLNFYSFDNFLEFTNERKKTISQKLKSISL